MPVDVEKVGKGVVRGYGMVAVGEQSAGEGCGEKVGEVEEVDTGGGGEGEGVDFIIEFLRKGLDTVAEGGGV